MNKRGLSPIIATILLIAFAVAIGAMIMSWTAGIVKDAPECSDLPEDIIKPSAFCKISSNVIAPQIRKGDKYVGCNEHLIEVDNLVNCPLA